MSTTTVIADEYWDTIKYFAKRKGGLGYIEQFTKDVIEYIKPVWKSCRSASTSDLINFFDNYSEKTVKGYVNKMYKKFGPKGLNIISRNKGEYTFSSKCFKTDIDLLLKMKVPIAKEPEQLKLPFKKEKKKKSKHIVTREILVLKGKGKLPLIFFKEDEKGWRIIIKTE